MFRTLLILTVFSFLFAGCGESPTVAKIEKENHSPMLPPALPSPGVQASPIQWKTPAGWVEQPLSEMRQGSFLIKDKNGKQADMSVTSFPGDAGGDLPNINRWRGQLQLAPIDQGALAKSVTSIKSQENEFQTVELVGKSNRMLGAILHRPDRTWFFKMMGDDSVVASQKQNFTAFLKSVRFDATSAPVSQATPAKSHAASSPADTVPAAPSVKKIQWKKPAHWKEVPLKGMRQGSFAVSGKDGREADVSIVSLGGNGGGALANINMWRSQLLLPPLTESSMSKATTSLKLDGRQGLLANVVSDKPVLNAKDKGAIRGAIVFDKDQTWFIKMSGEESIVSQEKQTFDEFLKSIRFPRDS